MQVEAATHERRSMKEEIPMKVFEAGDSSMTGRSLAAAAFQYSYDKRKNLERFEEFIATAARKGADLLVFPEQSLQGYVWETEMSWELTEDVLRYHYENSETIPGPATDRLCELSSEYGMLIAFGMTERHPHYGTGKGGLYNSGVLVSGEGVVSVHRKVHVCGTEKHIYRPGRNFGVADTEIGRAGMLICYDLVFPESARASAVLGADILIFMADWARAFDPPLLGHLPALNGAEQNHFLDALLGVRAFENQVWIVFGSAAGTDDRSLWEDGGSPKQYHGQAKIVDPEGVTRIETPLNVEGLAIAHGCDIEGAIVKSRTSAFWGDSFMYDRRPSAYEVLADENMLYPDEVGLRRDD